MADVFISYKSDRRAVVEQLSRVLELNGYSVWYDHALVAGEGFSQAIERELRSARAVVVTWCSLSVASDWVREEANLAKRLRTLIPVRLERVDVPLGFATLQSIDLSRWDGAPRSDVLDRLLLEVARFVGRDPAPQVRELIAFERAWRHSSRSSPTMPVSRRDAQPMPSAGPAPSGTGTHAPEESAVQDLGAKASPSATGRGSTAATTKGPTDCPDTMTAAEPARPDKVLSGSASSTADALAPPAAPALPDRPSIAVLPFINLSEDPGQEYLADGIVEGIITALCRKRWLFVIARNSSFTYKGRAVDVKQVGHELGVRYVLEGSLQKSSSRLRIGIQLLDAATGAHLSAERFDRMIEDVFELQDEVSDAVVGTLTPQLANVEISRARQKPTASLDAYDHYLRGVAALRELTRESVGEAIRLFGRVTEIDPDFAAAYGEAAICYEMRNSNGWTDDWDAEVAEATRLARRAAALGKGDAVALRGAAHVIARFDDIDAGDELIGQALALDPNLADAWLTGGWIKVWLGEVTTAIERFARAARLSPVDPWIAAFQGGTAAAHFIAGRFDEALLWAAKSLRNTPNYGPALRVAAAACALGGRPEEARKALADLRIQDPTLRLSTLRERAPWGRDGLALLVEGLRTAGLPE